MGKLIKNGVNYSAGPALIDGLNSTDANYALTAKQGNVLANDIGPVESGNTAAYAHPVGDFFMWKGSFVKVTSAITVGDTINSGSGGNVTVTKVSEQLSQLNSNLTNKADKVTSATSGDFAALDSSGNLTDSGKKASDFAGATEIINENLLKNAYFMGGGSQQGGGQFPINDTGLTNYDDGGYSTINGWSLSGPPNNSELEIVSDGIILTHPSSAGTYTLLQSIENYQQFLGKTLTMSFLGSLLEGSSCQIVAWYHPNTQNYDGSYNVTSFEDGLVTATFTVPSDATGLCILVASDGTYNPYKLKLKAAKLELGSKQTLAHKVDDAWVLNSPPPNFALELAKCNASPWETYGRKGNIVSQADITSIRCTGSTNTTGSTIYKGTLFYLNNQLCYAKSDISTNATFTLNTNYGLTTMGDNFIRVFHQSGYLSPTDVSLSLRTNILSLEAKDASNTGITVDFDYNAGAIRVYKTENGTVVGWKTATLS